MVHVELTADPRLVSQTARYLADVAVDFGMPKERANALCFLLEALLELRASQLADPKETLSVDVRDHGGRLRISVLDKGVPYMPTENQMRVFDNARLGRLTFEQLAVGGQRLTFDVDRASGYVGAAPVAREQETLLDTDITCRLTSTSDEDILEAIRCLWEVYGYSYMHQDLYHSDQYRDLLEGGRYVSALAENAHGQVLGHAALEEHEWFGGLLEVCNLVVKPIGSGHGVAHALVDYLVETALADGTRNLYTLPVVQHPITQEIVERAGFVPTGMLGSAMDLGKVAGYEDRAGRMSGMCAVRKVVEDGDRVLYLPQECADFVADVLDRSRMGWRAGTDGQGRPRQTRLTYSVDAVRSFAEVKLDDMGPDATSRLTALYDHLLSRGPITVTVYLNAREPRCPVCYDFLRSRGLAFTGCLPGARDGDYIMLQHLLEGTFDKDGVVATPGNAEVLERLYRINGW